MTKGITIIGGGLAGLALGIGLRRQSVPVTLYEAGTYPRHRVCGEFISGGGQQSLERLGLASVFVGAGTVPARTAAFFSQTEASPVRFLPEPALCLSRWHLDAALADEFRRLGGDLRTGHRLPGENSGEGMVRATGRRLAAEGGARWFGLKIHARKVSLAADLEMHVSPLGYVGLCRVGNGEVNVCGLFRRLPGGRGPGTPARLLLGGLPGSLLQQRLATAEYDDHSFCSVAGLELRPRRAAAHPDVCVGDAMTMIAPVTGNGMSMAFESAELAVAPVVAWCRGERTWPETRSEIAGLCDRRFTRRLAWAHWLQKVVLAAPCQNLLVRCAGRSDWFWRLAFARTR